MNYLDLRQKYPVFSFDNYDLDVTNSFPTVHFRYSISNLKFTHTIIFENLTSHSPESFQKIDNFLFHIGLVEMTNYWKLTCSPTIEINPGFLTESQINWWNNLFINGFGQYFYENKIDFTPKDFLKINNKSAHKPNKIWKSLNNESSTTLVPLGGGIDSYVTSLLLKQNNIPIKSFIVRPGSPSATTITATLETYPPYYASRIFDPQLSELNKQGFLNGHVPYSAVLAFISLFISAHENIKNIAFSQERSSDEANTTYLGHNINHQYTKSLEFETLFHDYAHNYLSQDLNYFSFVRPLYSTQIVKLFTNIVEPHNLQIVRSCNKNQQQSSWCNQCPKCVSTALMLSQFIGKNKVSEIMGSYPPALPENQQIMDELTGKSPVKPFECVLTRDEANACLTGQGLTEILNSWQNNPNMPEEFENILKKEISKS